MQSLLKLQKLQCLCKTPLIKEWVPLRYKTYVNLKPVSKDLSKYTNFEESRNPEEWKFVEQLLPSNLIPEPKYESNLPSGYKPATVKPGMYPYHIQRSRNHMLPVYLVITHEKSMPRKRTKILRISGDIWKLEESLQKHLAKLYPHELKFPVRINEVYSQLIFRGDYYSAICKFFYDRGF